MDETREAGALLETKVDISCVIGQWAVVVCFGA